MNYLALYVVPVPPTSAALQTAINNAVPPGRELVSIAIDSTVPGGRLAIVVK